MIRAERNTIRLDETLRYNDDRLIHGIEAVHAVGQLSLRTHTLLERIRRVREPDRPIRGQHDHVVRGVELALPVEGVEQRGGRVGFRGCHESQTARMAGLISLRAEEDAVFVVHGAVGEGDVRVGVDSRAGPVARVLVDGVRISGALEFGDYNGLVSPRGVVRGDVLVGANEEGVLAWDVDTRLVVVGDGVVKGEGEGGSSSGDGVEGWVAG